MANKALIDRVPVHGNERLTRFTQQVRDLLNPLILSGVLSPGGVTITVPVYSPVTDGAGHLTFANGDVVVAPESGTPSGPNADVVAYTDVANAFTVRQAVSARRDFVLLTLTQQFGAGVGGAVNYLEGYDSLGNLAWAVGPGGNFVGSGRDLAFVPQKLFDYHADAATTSTSGAEDDLYSDDVAADRLVRDGDTLHVRYAGSVVGHATATRRVKVYVGGTAVLDTTALTSAANSDWEVRVLVVRDSTTSLRYAAVFTDPGLSAAVPVAVGAVTGLTLTNPQTVKVTGAAAGVGAAAGDITAKLGTIEYSPAAA